MSSKNVLLDADDHAITPDDISERINKFEDSYKDATQYIIQNSKELDKNGEVLPDFRTVTLNCPLSNPTLADIDNNGYLNIVMTGGGKIFAYNYAGILLSNFPIEFEQGFQNQRYPDPILADIDGDGLAEIIVSSQNNQLLAFDVNGKKERYRN